MTARLSLASLACILRLCAVAQTPLPGGTVYPRVLRLSHGPAAANGQLIASTDGVIFRSTDDGHSFQRVTTVPVHPGSKRVCCSTLYEVPRTVGALAAGTLLSAGTYARSRTGSGTPVMHGTDFFYF